MKIIHLPSFASVSALPRGCAAALGFFDGVHIGHRAILDAAKKNAAHLGSASAVWMIESRNGSFKGTPQLTDESEKLRLIADCGIDYAVISPFDEIRSLSGEEFVREVLKERLGLAACVCGFNFRFGRGALCSADELSRYCKEVGIEHIRVPAVTLDGESVSSSRIRTLISNGELEAAAELLARPYYYNLPVLSGKQLGRKLGIPTANQIPPSALVCPPHGVYATSLEITHDDGVTESYAGCTNLGCCPTITDELLAEIGETSFGAGAADRDHAVLETYIDGFSGSLYGKTVKLSVLSRLRGEMKFPDTDALVCRVRRDIDDAREIYKKYIASKGGIGADDT